MAWASWGLEVLPLKGKLPLTRHGHLDATTNQAQIENWWRRFPTANIGARPSPGVVVLDIDPRNGGDATWHDLNAGRELPATLVTRTGSGGLHIWYTLPHAGDVKATAGEGIDIKTHQGLLVMPGSTHPDTGRRYEVESWHNPDALPTLPEHLHRYVFKPPARPMRVIPTALNRAATGGASLIQGVADAAPGTRNNTLNRAAFIAYKNGLNIDDELADAAAAAGLPEPEIMRTLASARRAARGVAA